MAKLIYSAMTSIDGYVADENGDFSWIDVDEEVHAHANDAARSLGIHLYGRKMYEVMVFWENPELDGEPAVMREYASIWQEADKVVYSTTLQDTSSARTCIESAFDADAVRAMKASTGRDISIGGPHLAAHALAAGVVDEIQLYVAPVVVGNGNRALPDRFGAKLELLDERRFTNGTVFLRYALAGGDQADR